MKILLVDDDSQSLDSTRRILEFSDFQVQLASDGEKALEILKTESNGIDLIVSDIRMPQMNGMELLKLVQVSHPTIPVILMTAFGSIQDAVEAMKLGAVDFLTKPFRRQALLDAVEVAAKRKNIKSILKDIDENETIVGSSRPIQKLKMLITQVANSDATVLVTGESGVGKELVAKQIHAQSKRSNAPFVAINCAAIPENLMESELFGHEKGAFSGADQTKKGLFEVAHGGTLLLDEIGDMPYGLQAKLLRVLQDGEVRRLGSTESKKIDVRLISSTNQDLLERVREGQFREDLKFRLDVIQLEVPSLRERLDDIEMLSLYFVSKMNQKHERKIEGIDSEAIDSLKNHPWPGNVRELYNVIERSLVLCDGTELKKSHLPEHIQKNEINKEIVQKSSSVLEVPIGSKLKDVEDILIEKTLEAAKGDKNTAARILGVNSRTIYRKLEKKQKQEPSTES